MTIKDIQAAIGEVAEWQRQEWIVMGALARGESVKSAAALAGVSAVDARGIVKRVMGRHRARMAAFEKAAREEPKESAAETRLRIMSGKYEELVHENYHLRIGIRDKTWAEIRLLLSQLSAPIERVINDLLDAEKSRHPSRGSAAERKKR